MAIYKIITDGKIERLEGMQRVILDIASGIRKPENEQDRRLLKQIKEIKDKGGMLNLPFD